MTDREKVIAALEKGIATAEAVEGDFVYITKGEARISVELLKEQEPRLITNEDFNNADEWGFLPAWCETTDGRVYCEIIPERALYHGPCRYWTAMPTDEQRKAMKWNA